MGDDGRQWGIDLMDRDRKRGKECVKVSDAGKISQGKRRDDKRNIGERLSYASSGVA
ncbi:hypothetical protein GCM10007285_26860 [Stappia taiwanensis]|nr:hypothetical protein GCM10007285_26860 [Stappia taiwanensis]